MKSYQYGILVLLLIFFMVAGFIMGNTYGFNDAKLKVTAYYDKVYSECFCFNSVTPEEKELPVNITNSLKGIAGKIKGD